MKILNRLEYTTVDERGVIGSNAEDGKPDTLPDGEFYLNDEYEFCVKYRLPDDKHSVLYEFCEEFLHEVSKHIIIAKANRWKWKQK